MNIHEKLTPKHAVRRSSDRSFGILFAVFFVFVGLAPQWKHLPPRSWALALSGVFLGVAILRPIWLHVLNQLWMKIGLLLGRVVNPIVMVLLFVVVVTPTALIFRLFGKDPLRLSLDGGARSYWIERCPPGPSPETMSTQF